MSEKNGFSVIEILLTLGVVSLLLIALSPLFFEQVSDSDVGPFAELGGGKDLIKSIIADTSVDIDIDFYLPEKTLVYKSDYVTKKRPLAIVGELRKKKTVPLWLGQSRSAQRKIYFDSFTIGLTKLLEGSEASSSKTPISRLIFTRCLKNDTDKMGSTIDLSRGLDFAVISLLEKKRYPFLNHEGAEPKIHCCEIDKPHCLDGFPEFVAKIFSIRFGPEGLEEFVQFPDPKDPQALAGGFIMTVNKSEEPTAYRLLFSELTAEDGVKTYPRFGDVKKSVHSTSTPE